LYFVFMVVNYLSVGLHRSFSLIQPFNLLAGRVFMKRILVFVLFCIRSGKPV